MEIFHDRGINIGRDSELAVDTSARTKAKNAFITHAHSDHVALNKKSKYLMSHATKDLVEARYGPIENCQTADFGEKIPINGCSLSMHNSGHILGSSQILVENNKKSERIVITSDFKLQDSLFMKRGEVLDSDILVIECTFGIPCFEFPEREETYNEMGTWIKQNAKQGLVLLAGYSIGKAQELTAVCNEYAGIAPLVHDSVFEINKIYENHSVHLGDYIKLNHNLKESNVIIIPPSLVKKGLAQSLSYSTGKKIFTAFATGWQRGSSYDKLFSLSDHADFSQLMQYVKESNPKLVLTMHGYDKEFAAYVQRRLKIPARALVDAGQKTIGEF
ncbi:MAG: MBL fold metallo-hydrolase [Candidatus Diapherotrites archaeon]